VTGSTYTFANGLSIDNATNNVMTWKENSEDLLWTVGTDLISLTSSTGVVTMDFGAVVPKTTKIKVGSITYTLPTAYGTATYVLSDNGSGTLSWVSNAATFVGGAISSDCTLANGVDLMSSTTTAESASIKVYDLTAAAAYSNVLSWTNGTEPAIVLGAATNTLSIVSSGGLQVSTAGVVTGATGITDTGTLTNTGAITQTGGIVSLNNASNYAVNVCTGNSSGLISLGGGSGTLAIDTTGWDITSGGVFSGLSNMTFLTGSKIRASGTTAETLAIQAYDVDGLAYEDSILITNGAVPAIAIGSGTDTLAINTSDWDITSAGVMTGIGAITSDGLFTGTLGMTVSGAAVSLNAASNFAVTVGGGTGAMNIATDATAQTVNFATGTGVKATTVGSTNTTSATTVQSGSGDLSLTSTDAITMTSAGVFGIGANAVAQIITVGNNTTTSALSLIAGTGKVTIASAGTGADAIDIDTSAGGIDIDMAGAVATEDFSITTSSSITLTTTEAVADQFLVAANGAVAGNAVNIATADGGMILNAVGAVNGSITVNAGHDITINPTAAAGVINIGTSTPGVLVNIGTNDTTADAIAIGSAKDTTTVTGTLTVNSDAITLGNAVTDVVTVTGKVAGATPLTFDGTTANTVYTIFAMDDPASSSKTITFPAVTGTVKLTGAATVITAGGTPALTVVKGTTLYTDTITTDNEDQTITFSGAGAAGD
ncbi:MAG: hypothetical protein IMZ53_02145, partial [Thermoplasmata archaeon]|nr:hypothetical protein [Thermoplasmata archaeon]